MRPLTRAQYTALYLASYGLPQRTIARKMNTTQTAVCVMLRRACRKLDAISTTHAVRLAFESGLLSAGPMVREGEPPTADLRQIKKSVTLHSS